MPGKHSKDYSEEYEIKQYSYSNNRKKSSENKKNSKNKKYNENKYSKSSSNKNRRKNSKGMDLIFKILAVVYLVITISFYISILKMNLLPNSYIIAFTIAEIIFTFAITIGLGKKRKKHHINIICLIIAIIISALYIYANKYATATSEFFKQNFKTDIEIEETEDYYIVTKKENSYNELEDIKGKEIHFYQIEDDVRLEISSKVAIRLKAQDNLVQIGESLLKDKVDAILLSSAQYAMLSDEISKFDENTKIIYTATHKIKKTEEVEEKPKEETNDGIFNVYISGIDTTGRISNVSRSDANIVATVNTKTHEVLLTSIPRDYYVTLHSKKAKDKLTHSGIYGINETVTTVEDLLDIDIDYYVRVNFTTVIKLVDTLGGIDVNSEYSFTSQDGYYFSKGINHVNGAKALSFSRERDSFASGDNQRVKNQQHVIEAIIKKALSGTILTKYTSILKTLENSFQTNIDQNVISDLVKHQLESMPSWTIKTNSLTGSNASRTTYSAGSQYLYVMIPDETSVKNAKDQISEIMKK